MTRINRRQALALLSSTALTTACATQSAPEAKDASASFTDPDIFRHGVASGDPDTTSVVIWTRVSTGSPIVEVAWAIYEDPEGNSPVSRAAPARPRQTSDYTVKVIADGLQPGQSILLSIRSRRRSIPHRADPHLACWSSRQSGYRACFLFELSVRLLQRV
jgi:alkaline phosphatase D